MNSNQTGQLLQLIREQLSPFSKSTKNYYPILDFIGDSHYVLLGGDTHGTHQFYESRAEISRLLIEEKGFNAIAVEADFTDVYYINRYIRGMGPDSLSHVLSHFKGFPQWLMRNREIENFISIVNTLNLSRSPEKKIGFYGLDLYSMYSSVESVLAYLETIDPEAALQARRKFECFDQYGSEDGSYGKAMIFSSDSCRDSVVKQLKSLQQQKFEYIIKDNSLDNSTFFTAQHNARLVLDSEQYYREMFNKKVNSWNIRDLHMTNTIDQISEHLIKTIGTAKVVVWAHNSHIGNALGTEFSGSGQFSVGQLMHYRHCGDIKLIGICTSNGTLTASSYWGGDYEQKILNPALPGSYQDIFHNTDSKAFFLDLHTISEKTSFFTSDHLERGIGTTYSPQTERISHYFNAKLADQFDAIIYFDTTDALIM